jgi:hypothetical protein
MTHRHPTIAELSARAQKGRHREVGNWLARRIARPTAIYGCWLAVRLGLSAHEVTGAAWLCSLAGAAAIGTGDRVMFLLGVLLAHLAFWLDHVDGQVARWSSTAGLDGVYLDYMMHHACNLAMGFGLGHGIAAQTGELYWTVAGFLTGGGWMLLGLHNDCRYKAFFQRLKSARGSFRVDGARGRLTGAPGVQSRRIATAFYWPLYKACEPHVVLLLLTALAALAALAPSLWFGAWRAAVCAFAVLAPVLGIARMIRAVREHAVESEFGWWFIPIDAGRHGSADTAQEACFAADRSLTETHPAASGHRL